MKVSGLFYCRGFFVIRPGQKIKPSDLPDSLRELHPGRYHGETDEGLGFELVVNSTTRGMTGNEMVKATIDGMRRGRPGPSTLRVQQTEIYIMISRQPRRDIRDNGTGYYSHGSMGSRSLREVVEMMLRYYGPRPAPVTPPSIRS